MANLPASLSADVPGSNRPVAAAPTARLWAPRWGIDEVVLWRDCDYLVDSSALVKRYVLETGTAWVRGITRKDPSTVIYIAHITAVEVTCAVARRRKGKTLTPPRASSVLRRFRQHLAA